MGQEEKLCKMASHVLNPGCRYHGDSCKQRSCAGGLKKFLLYLKVQVLLTFFKLVLGGVGLSGNLLFSVWMFRVVNGDSG